MAPGEKCKPPRSARGFWPREHGAYVQLLAPLLSALAFASPTPAALACVGLALALFLAHEPLLVLRGRRGAKWQAMHARAARIHLMARLAAASLLALGLVLWAPRAVLIGLLVPAALSVIVLVTLLLEREQSLSAELLGATALTSFCVPVLVAQDVPPDSIVIFASGWLAAQVLATLTAHAYVYRRRDGERALQAATVGAMLLFGVTLLLAAGGHVPLAVCLALGPFALVALALRAHAYRPRTPKGVGWALAVANVSAIVLLGTILSRGP